MALKVLWAEPIPIDSCGESRCHRTRIGQVPLVKLFHQPFVGAEVGWLLC